ncbi:glutathionylspermidine synthase family protein [Azoarcus indigens]|uniref:Glutathionylspermidine synthase n=1 Tax=Azoarcus indigens TaxID=29545 RepID=A0A4R6DTZ8_9RHOO|nr:glutathionylspermidine synthase family protein [Azoarcus indigens]NMG67990.1 glutathionylspermidine synthase family protein [Azoarcus indigens]TDN48154.1 glutathionylspermidine synthase [Azoarcus indigens]
MRRLDIAPRKDYRQRLEQIGFSFHSWDDYWHENACYAFSAAQIDELEAATEELHALCVDAARFVIERDRFDQLGIPAAFHQPIADAFARGEPSLYGRFDLAYDGHHPPKLLEYNADTPTSLLETAVAQWYWLEEYRAASGRELDQFNSVHEKLVARWRAIAGAGLAQVDFASVADNEEDWVCTHYLMDTAAQAGLGTSHIYMEDIGWDPLLRAFVDLAGRPLQTLFKLYPWEWLMREPFSEHIPGCSTRFVEPMWKALLSCKGLLPILWERNPGHPNLLEAHFTPGRLASYARKPLFSREGANIELYENGELHHSDGGPYGAEGHIYQALHPLARFGPGYPVIGAWVVGDEAAGMCIREDDTPITTNLARFVPHYFD